MPNLKLERAGNKLLIFLRYHRWLRPRRGPKPYLLDFREGLPEFWEGLPEYPVSLVFTHTYCIIYYIPPTCGTLAAS